MVRHPDPRARSFQRLLSTLPIFILSGLLLHLVPLGAQEVGVIRGRVVDAADGRPVYGAEVQARNLARLAFTDRRGEFALERVPAGAWTLVVSRLGYAPRELQVTVDGAAPVRVSIELDVQAVRIGEITVTSASRTPQRVVDAPAAVSLVSPERAREFAVTHQAPRALAGLPGVRVVQSGIHDFNVNARGFNTTLNRRVLVLQDGRDLSVAFLGSQEWAALSVPLEEMERVEMVRGPGSALYGANAFSGVLSLTTPAVREAPGTRVSISGGELGTLDADGRHAQVLGGGRFGYRVSGGVYRSDSWSRSRTALRDLEEEYGPAVDLEEHPVSHPAPGYEVLPLLGQEKDGAPGEPGPALGEPDPLMTAYGTARLDWYGDGGSVFTLETGTARAENHVNLTPVGRIQVARSDRPWARLAWASERWNASAWYSGRISKDQYGLASGFRIAETSALYQAEVQYNRELAGGRGRLVGGGSIRASGVDSDTTFVPTGDDDRLDGSYALFGQVEWELGPSLRAVLASRLDGGALFQPQVSPKAALVYTPSPGSSLRFSVHRAFKTPNILEYFLAVPAGPEQDLTQLEDGLRASPLGSSLENVPEGELFTDTDQVPVFAYGNRDLEVEAVTGLEVGYKALLGERLYVTADAFYSRLTNLITDLLPGANPRYGPWTAPATVPASARPLLEAAVRQIVGGEGLTRLSDGRTAFVISIGNAGEAEAYGLELAAGFVVGSQLRLDANYTYFGSDVKDSSLLPGDRVVPNTPEHSGTVSASYRGYRGLDARVEFHGASGFDWSSGIYAGYVPGRWTVDLALGYRVGEGLRVTALAMNVLDREHYEAFGGSVLGRRALLGLSLTR